MAHFAVDAMASKLASGLLSFPVTHFDESMAFNRPSYEAHLDWMLSYDLAGVFAPGGTGEFFSLSLDEIEQVVISAVQVVNGRVPVLAGAGHNTSLAIETARRAERAGADGVLLFPPYLINASQKGLAAHIKQVCHSTSLGVIAYNRDNMILQAETLADICESCPNFVGLKDGLGDIELMVRIAVTLGDRLIYIGGLPTAETFALPYLSLGATTYSSALLNFLPEFALHFYQAVRANNAGAVNASLRDFVLPYIAIRNRQKGYAVSIVKAGTRLIGRAAGAVRPPLADLDSESLNALNDLIQQPIARPESTVVRASVA